MTRRAALVGLAAFLAAGAGAPDTTAPVRGWASQTSCFRLSPRPGRARARPCG